MAGKPTQIDIEDAFLYATTTGAFYDKHCTMVRRNASSFEWRDRVKTIMLAYNRELRVNGFLTNRDVGSLALRLRGHYMEHVNEGKGN